MAWTFSKRELFYRCKAAWHARYVERRRTPQSDPMLIGIAADQLLEAVVAARMEGKLKPSELPAFLRKLVDDVVDMDGVITSHKQSAAWIIEHGLTGALTPVLKRMKGCKVSTQEQLYFDEKWQLTKQRPGEHIGAFKNRSVYGGDLDVLILDGNRAYIPDWKSGKSRWSKPKQVREYMALVMAALPEIEHAGGSLVWLAENKIEDCGTMDRREAEKMRKEIEREASEIAACTDFTCEGCRECAS